jgi:cell cycle sensor histidine kinase DivJ
MHQIMLNLVVNALKFTPRGGRVTVSARPEGEFIAVSIEDTGVGIDAEDLPRVGDPFFQAKSTYDRRHDGTGLGVSIVKGLLALHGGRLQIHSRLGEGTRVTAFLPLDCQRARAKSDLPALANLPSPIDRAPRRREATEIPMRKSA